MRPRKWVLFFAILFLLLSLCFYFGKRRLEQNRNLEKLLVEAVAPSIKGSFTLDAVRIGLFSVYLRNVRVTLPMQSVTVEISSIKIGFSFLKLLKSRGDVATSINRIILIQPHLTYLLAQQSFTDDKPSSAPKSTAPEIVFPQSALQTLLVKNGQIDLCNKPGKVMVSAAHLSGVLINQLFETRITISGEFGSSRKNLSLQGIFSASEAHHLSIRLADAVIDQPLMFNDYTVSGGRLNGALECTFNHVLIPDSTDIHGWLSLANGGLSFPDQRHRLDSISTKILLDSGGCHITTGKAVYRGVAITAAGTWHYRPSLSAELSLNAASVSPSSLADFTSDTLIYNLKKIDSVAVNILWNGTHSAHVTTKITGLHLKSLLVNSIIAQGVVSQEECIIDSLRFTAGNFYGFMSGIIPFADTRKKSDLNFQMKCDRFPDSLKLKGTTLLSGTVSGSLASPEVTCRMISENLSYDNLSAGNLQCILTLSGDSCSISSVNKTSDSSIVFDGTIRHLFKQPEADITARIASGPIKSYLTRNYKLVQTDSAFVSLTANGWMESYTATIDCHLRSKAFSGNVLLGAFNNIDEPGKIFWKMKTSNTRINNYPADASAEGYFTGGMLTVTNLHLLEGISGKGTIELSTKVPRFNVRFDYRTTLPGLMRYLPEMDPPVDSGIVSGYTLLSGIPDSITTTSRLHFDQIYKGTVGDFTAQLTMATTGNNVIIQPCTVKLKSQEVIRFDTISYVNNRLSFRGMLDNFSPAMLFPPAPDQTSSIPETKLSGSFTTTDTGLPIEFVINAPSLSFSTIHLDSIACKGRLDAHGAVLTKCTFTDANRTTGRAAISFPWAFISKETTEKDTLSGTVHLQGDLLATIQRNFDSPVGGNGVGTADLSFINVGGSWKFSPGNITIPKGTMRVYPFVPDKVKNYTCQFTIDSTGIVHTDMSGTIKKRPIRIFSSHTLPDGIEPVTIGPFDFGMLQVVTPKKGVDLHLPGFLVKKDRGDIEFKGKGSCSHFTLSGPLEKLKLTGTWVLRDLDFTFPLLADREIGMASDPFPYITWDMDLKVGNRNVLYFWDLSGKKNRIVRFVEGYLDLSSHLRLRGRDLDKTFQVLGSIRSYKGAVYYGQVFDRNFDVGVEFHPQKPQKNVGYENLPFLWGSAETFADTSRHKRVKLTCMVVDSITGRVSEKGRLSNAPTPNISFHLSSDFDELPGESERDFYRQAGLTFTTIDGAGGAVTNFGEQMFHRYLLQRWERLVAKKLGLDVINIETSIVSNYFSKLYSRQFDGFLHQDDFLALANVGLTVGRYFFRDYLFLKARGELIPVEMMLTPEYSIGFEFQPSRYLLMDINYGFHKTETSFQHNPLLMLQLRLPITSLRKSLKF